MLIERMERGLRVVASYVKIIILKEHLLSLAELLPALSFYAYFFLFKMNHFLQYVKGPE